MNITVKAVKQNNEQFAPITVAEAVLVKQPNGVKRLDEVLRIKLEGVSTPEGSGLTSSVDGNVVTITHVNSIYPNYENFKNVAIKYDNRGHIIGTQDIEPLNITIQDLPYLSYDGLQSGTMALGDDFASVNGKIQIRWNEIT